MLHEFLVSNREEILGRSRSKLAARQVPRSTESEVANGLPLFLDQLISILRAEKGDRSAGHLGVTASAAVHGGDLLRDGFTVGQVVQDYGSICQSARSLRRMRALIDRTLAEVRLEAGTQKPERVSIAQLIEEIEIVATLEANDKEVQLSVDPGSHDVAVEADPQILSSALANLVQNAFKFTRPNGHWSGTHVHGRFTEGLLGLDWGLFSFGTQWRACARVEGQAWASAI